MSEKWYAQHRQMWNALLKFLALSHEKDSRIFACENRRILTQKTESRAASHMPVRERIIFQKSSANLLFSWLSIDYNCKNSLLFKRYDKEAVDRISFCEIVSRAFFVFKQKSRSRQRSRRYPRLLRLYLRPFLSWSVWCRKKDLFTNQALNMTTVELVQLWISMEANPIKLLIMRSAS